MQNSHPTILTPEDHAHLERLMCTMTGSRTAIAMLLRRKLDTAVIIPPANAGEDLVTSGSTVRFVVDGARSMERRLTWSPQEEDDASNLSLRLPRGLALLGLSAGQSIPYRTDDGGTEFLEVEQVDPASLSPAPRKHSADGQSPARSAGGLAEMFRSALVRLQRGRTITALQRLDDAMLKDIGITRGEISHIADIVSGIVEPPAERQHIAPRPRTVLSTPRVKASAQHEHVQ